MKRDARIGMAVVLVLGLSVTLLIARSLYKHGSTVELEGEAADASTTAKKLDADPTFTIPSGHPAAQLEITPPLVTAPDVVGPLPPDNPQPAGPVATSQNTPATPAVPTTYYGYTVASGDSPWKISSKLFGDGKYTQKIVDANGGGSLAMKPGTVIKIPSIANRPLLVKLQPFGEKPSHSPAAAATTSKEHGHEEDHTGKSTPAGKLTTYKIAKGDTLALIAKKTYGANGPSTIEKIVAANKGLDAGHLQVGMEIKLPAK